MANAAGLLTGRPSGLAIQAVEEAAVVRLHWEAVRSLFEADHALERASQAAAALARRYRPLP